MIPNRHFLDKLNVAIHYPPSGYFESTAGSLADKPLGVPPERKATYVNHGHGICFWGASHRIRATKAWYRMLTITTYQDHVEILFSTGKTGRTQLI
jgi:hypothetical protein